MDHTDSFFDQPPGDDGPGFVVNGRYAIKHPTTGKDATWQRASNFGSPLADHFAIGRWQQRELIRGLNRREDLIELVRTATEISNADADAWIKSAHETAAVDAKANRGTAVHEVLRAFDTGQQYSERYRHIVNGYGIELDRQGLTPVGAEVVVLNVPLGAAGKLDRVYRERSGAYVLGDVKTGRLDYAVHEYAVQLAVYSTASHLVDDDGNPRPLPWVLRQDYAVLIHVDPTTGESSTYRIDLTLARRAANLAVQVRAWRATKDVALPYVPPDAAETAQLDSPTTAMAAALTRVIEADAPPANLPQLVSIAVDQATGGVAVADLGNGPVLHTTQTSAVPPTIAQPYRNGPVEVIPATADFPCRFDGKMASAHPIDIPGQFHCITPEPRPIPSVGEQRIRPDGVTVHFTGRDWEVLNPVQVANLAVPGDGPRAGMPLTGEGTAALATDTAPLPHVPPSIARTEPPSQRPAIDPETEAAELAKLPKTELQRMLKALGGTDLAHHRKWLAEEIVKRKNAAQADGTPTGLDSFNGVPMPQPGSAMEGPRPAAEQTPHTIALIGAAGSVADLSRIRDKIVSVGGDQAWTDEMTEAARARAAELDEGDRQSVLARIDAAGGSQELAALWAELTLSGTAPSHWTDEYQQRATERLNAINAAAVSGPPVNPFAN